MLHLTETLTRLRNICQKIVKTMKIWILPVTCYQMGTRNWMEQHFMGLIRRHHLTSSAWAMHWRWGTLWALSLNVPDAAVLIVVLALCLVRHALDVSVQFWNCKAKYMCILTVSSFQSSYVGQFHIASQEDIHCEHKLIYSAVGVWGNLLLFPIRVL